MYTGRRFKLKKNNARNVTEKKPSAQPSVFKEEEDEIQPQRKQISSTRSGSVVNNRPSPQPSVLTEEEEEIQLQRKQISSTRSGSVVNSTSSGGLDQRIKYSYQMNRWNVLSIWVLRTVPQTLPKKNL